MSDITINVKAPSVNVNATPQSNVIAPKMQMIRGGSVTVDDELSLTSENPVQNKVITSALNEKAPIIINTASGEIASIPDGADDMPIRSLVANIEPVQEGSGDPSPTNIRPISGWTGANIYQEAVYDESATPKLSISWESEAGTVYGGTLDVTTGVLTVDRAMVDLGTLDYTYGDNYKIFIASLSGVKNIDAAQVPSMISSMYKAVSWTAGATDATKDGIMCILPAYNQLRLRNLGYTDPTAFKTAMSGQTIVYELATPQTYQLTPQEVSTLFGTNNVWADTGDTAVEYRADTKLYIQKLTQPTEDDMTANANIAANTFFMIGNTLYFSTAAIAAGATIIPGTNCNMVSLADALNQLNS